MQAEPAGQCVPRRSLGTSALEERYGHMAQRGCPCIVMGLFSRAIASCSSDGHFSILGYTTQPNYDCGIHTVYVPIFQNVTYTRGLEFQLTQAVIREIEAKTPFKVTDCRANADTELIGKIVSTSKGVITLNQLGEVREVDSGMSIELVWRDLRPGSTGVLLSTDPRRKKSAARNCRRLSPAPSPCRRRWSLPMRPTYPSWAARNWQRKNSSWIAPPCKSSL